MICRFPTDLCHLTDNNFPYFNIGRERSQTFLSLTHLLFLIISPSHVNTHTNKHHTLTHAHIHMHTYMIHNSFVTLSFSLFSHQMQTRSHSLSLPVLLLVINVIYMVERKCCEVSKWGTWWLLGRDRALADRNLTALSIWVIRLGSPVPSEESSGYNLGQGETIPSAAICQATQKLTPVFPVGDLVIVGERGKTEPHVCRRLALHGLISAAH